MEGGKKKEVSLRCFSADLKIAISGHPIARATSYCLLPDTDYGPPKIPLKLAV